MLLTRTGAGVAAASVALYTAGWLLHYPEPAMLGLAGLLAVAVALAWVLPHPDLRVTRDVVPRKVTRGLPAEGVMTVVNAGRRLRTAVQTTDACAGVEVPVRLPALAAGETRAVRYALPTMRRGLVPVGPLRLVRADPFAFARRIIEFGEPETLLVRPRAVDLGTFPAGRAQHLEGPTTEASNSGSGAFHSLREYVLGDDLRRVHWPSTARTGTIMIRQLVDVTMPVTTVVLDSRAGSYPRPTSTPSTPAAGEALDWFELAVDVAASVALSAARLNFPVRLHTAAGPLLETRGGQDDAGELLDRLALVSATPAGSMADAIEGVWRSREEGVLVVVTGAGASPSDLEQVAAVGSRFDDVAVIEVG
ncbi:MAG: DUF58 domain-containing protein, partial [Catenulispora sp.]|nr:DUF58 domain-containing protein [Catenulispora sp.]